jgi:lipopolysaccharide export system protein LptC
LKCLIAQVRLRYIILLLAVIIAGGWLVTLTRALTAR